MLAKIREYFGRVIEPREQCGELGILPPQDRMPSYYYNLILTKPKKIYMSRQEGKIFKKGTKTCRTIEEDV
ncbi:MAG: hypothetical protein WD876_03860 [Candidatus Pacearchaeota archaeon]